MSEWVVAAVFVMLIGAVLYGAYTATHLEDRA